MRVTLHNLQALRGVACLLVFFLHLGVWEKTFGIGRPLLGSFIWYGYAGVDLFFVLSGFLITHTQAHHLGRPAAVPGYLYRRAWRIYPTFWVVMLLGVGLYLASAGHWAYPTTPDAPGVRTLWLTWLTLAPSKIPNLYAPPAWSLSYEVMFYLAFAGLILLPRRFAPWLLGGWAAAVGVAAWRLSPVEMAANVWLAHLLSPFVWEFLLGCGVAWLVRRGTRFGGMSVAVGITWATVWVLSCADPNSPADVAGNQVWRVGVFGISSALIVYGVVAMEMRNGWRLPGWLRRTGDASYSIYLWHAPAGGAVYAATLAWSHTFWPHLGWLGLQTVIGVGGGFVLYWVAERPLLNMAKRRKVGREEVKVIEEKCRWRIPLSPAGRGQARPQSSAGEGPESAGPSPAAVAPLRRRPLPGGER